MRLSHGAVAARWLVLLGAAAYAGCLGADDPSARERRPNAAAAGEQRWYPQVVARQEPPSLDPVVEFPHEAVWRTAWFPIDNENRAQAASTRLVDLFLGLREGMRVADLGAGGGFFTFRIARAVGAGGRVLSTDIDTRMTRKVAWEARARGSMNVTVMQVTDRDLGLGDARFDAVLMNETPILALCDAAREQRVVQEVARALVPAGRWVYFSETPESSPPNDCAMPSEPHVRAITARYFDVVGVDYVDKPADDRTWTAFGLLLRRNDVPVQ